VRTDKTYQERRGKKKKRENKTERKSKTKNAHKVKQRERERKRHNHQEKRDKNDQGRERRRESQLEFAKTTIMCFMLTHWYPYNNNCALMALEAFSKEQGRAKTKKRVFRPFFFLIPSSIFWVFFCFFFCCLFFFYFLSLSLFVVSCLLEIKPARGGGFAGQQKRESRFAILFFL